MLVIHGYEHIPAKAQGAVITVGNFDGVHRGHQALIERTIAKACELERAAGVLVFEPHPREFFAPHEPHFRLTTIENKLEIFEALGLDLAIVLSFDANLAGLDAETFIKRILVDALKVSHVVVGYHFFFGKGRSGTPEILRTAGGKYGFGVTIVAPVAEAGDAFSSTAIRLHLAQGDMSGAARVLGRWWRVRGKVVGGAKRGAGLGFPTANIPLARGTALAHGIYAVRTYLDGKEIDGAAYLGTRPTFDDGMPVLEVFLFDFDGDLYGHEIEVEFIAHIRDDRKFDGPEALKAQMEDDCAVARKLLAAAGSGPI